ncbi:siderophore-interacting protein [Aestuariibacter sp. GS-14]|uniref:siderophore-interacting protein n=1 Tax=Aestuariibacter sp. GS-14 TaxID=2590670 RepID=UPI00112A99B4|nr:siderophore-interacting protein [Aestuariibacter sp. GS-14]TPV58520.1 siderophore-interacting protein [Aestuariibacter sp. GS-14]
MKKRNYYQVQVQSSQRLTPTMQRLVFQGEDLQRFPHDTPAGSYIKLLFNQYGESFTDAPAENETVLMRTYTVRHADAKTGTLTVDFMLHGEGVESGPASHWAVNAKPGDTLYFGGPGTSKGLADERDWVLLMGDMTALPAISAQLENLPADTKGYAVISIEDADDKQALTHPDNVDIIWVENAGSDTLASSLAAIRWLDGTPAVWAACEFSSMRAIRSALDEQFDIPRSQVYVTSYWRKGRSEDQHKIDKREDLAQYNG